jgi:hypothetical protein
VRLLGFEAVGNVFDGMSRRFCARFRCWKLQKLEPRVSVSAVACQSGQHYWVMAIQSLILVGQLC